MPKADLKKLLLKYRFVAFPLAIGGLILILTVFFLVPNISQIIKNRQELAQEKERLASLTQKLADLEGLDEVELSTRADLVLKALPVEKDVPLILTTLSGLGEETGVVLTKISATPGELSTAAAQKKESKTNSLDFEITISGTLGSITNFLDRLVSTLPVIQVNSVSLGADDPEAGVEISLDAYFFPLPETLGAVEKPIVKISTDEEIAYKKIEKVRPPPGGETLPLVGSGKENLFSF
ncbi:MAG TPA: type 4a pilus biogenesis protein PilO [Candidatus Bathyarchaeia archaeon]|nr:type 4a pilus biogenesis protein PilO [Candidatus Bathyarchaeia archaeon]